jgi:dienelactone hydrolase
MTGRSSCRAIGLLLAATAANAAAQQPVPPDAAAVARAMEEANKVPDTAGDGPYPAVMELDPALPNHVIYRPADLTPFAGGKLGVFAWGNGACADDGASSRQHLAEIASYGYLVIAPGKWRSGPNAKVAREAPRPAAAGERLPPPATTAENVREGLDFALAESARNGSPYANLIDKQAVAVGGFSCGGLQAISLAADPRISTVVVQNSGVFNDTAQSIGGMTVSKDALKAFHTPVLYLLGGPTDIAYANGTDDVKRITHVPVALVNLPFGHGGTYARPMGGAAAGIVVDWLEWQLRDNAGAGRTFVGANCRLCVNPEATIELRNFRQGSADD